MENKRGQVSFFASSALSEENKRKIKRDLTPFLAPRRLWDHKAFHEKIWPKIRPAGMTCRSA
jgi:hypothetical protein